ncbi:MAG: SusD/RagB family nutrient-binding outer membrane lipoprotein [Calditrichaeota bacterium]|nr:SusD/RagB family nutrient-binding outer membrane lipoprotein [Calditrichota bacterium]
MMKEIKASWTFLILIAFVGLLFVGCTDFLDDPELQIDPNRAKDVSPDVLLNTIQISHFFMQEGALARTFSMWMQQMSGTDRQYLAYDRYSIVEADHDGEFNDVYTGGGLVDIRKVIELCNANGWINYRGIAKVWEALVIGTAASIWGNIPYSEAANPDIPTPKLDTQAEIYAAIQKLLDDAIKDLQTPLSGFAATLPANDHVYGGDLGKWIRFAHSLKARYYLHWGEAFEAGEELPEGYTNPYEQALNHAANGINATDGDFKTKHSDIESESNTWYQFYRERDSYIRAGKFLVDLLIERKDPRLPIYFAPAGFDDSGNPIYVGSAPGEGRISASTLSSIFLDKSKSYDILTYEETLFIQAEAAFKLGDETTAREKLNQALRVIEAKWGLKPDTLGVYDDTVTGDALFEAIMMEKYIALFLNIEVFNDWKRTGYPKIVAFGANDYTESPDIIPHRLPISDDERQTNPNVDDPTKQLSGPDKQAYYWEPNDPNYGRNQNDPIRNPY